MICHISGRLRQKKADRIVVEVNGLGYEVLLPYFVRRTFDEREEGEPVELETYYYVSERQPRPILIGFNREHERSFFERLLQVEDMGPTKAARALVFSVSTVAKAIEEGDLGLLKRMEGIGERTAAKIVASLQGKVAEWALLRDEGFDTLPRVQEDLRKEVEEALVSLGYRRGEAKGEIEAALKRCPQLSNAEELLREVFRAQRAETPGR